jgi:hypothetical protein
LPDLTDYFVLETLRLGLSVTLIEADIPKGLPRKDLSLFYVWIPYASIGYDPDSVGDSESFLGHLLIKSSNSAYTKPEIGSGEYQMLERNANI